MGRTARRPQQLWGGQSPGEPAVCLAAALCCQRDHQGQGEAAADLLGVWGGGSRAVSLLAGG